MELAHLETLECVVREGSFTKAADILGFTQPSISARIAGLEKELGVLLFERQGRQLHLTTYGRDFLPYAQRALAAVKEGERMIQDRLLGQGGTVSIAAITTQMTWLLPAPIKRLREDYPAINVRVTPRTHPEIPRTLYNGETILGLSGTPVTDPGLTIHARFQVPICGVVGSEHPLVLLQEKKNQLSMKDIFPHTIVRANLGPQPTVFVESLIEKARRRYGGSTFSLPAIMAVDFVLSNQGVAFLPQDNMQPYVDKGQAVFLKLDDMPHLSIDPMLLTVRGCQLSEPVKTFIRIFKAQWRHRLVAA